MSRKLPDPVVTEMSRRRMLSVVAGAFALGACGGAQSPQTQSTQGNGSPQPTGNARPLGSRVIGIAPTDREDDQFDRVIDLVEGIGCQTVTLSLYWDEIETAPGIFSPQPDWPAIANAFYATRKVRLTVSLAGIDTNNDRRPADLAALPYDDPVVAERYLEACRFVLQSLADVEIEAFSVCNEIDATLGADVDQWQAFATFFTRVAPAIRALRSGMAVGAKATFGVVIDTIASAQYQVIADHADAWMLTYYPLLPDFTVKPPDAPLVDFARIAALPGNKPVRILEIGYPSAGGNGSSGEAQAAFVANMFSAWDANSSRIRQIDYFAMHDFSPAIVSTLGAYYRLDQPAPLAFLGSLGLRTWAGAGSAKPGWARFAAEIAARS